MRLRIGLVVVSCLLSLITGWALSRGGAPAAVEKHRVPLIGVSLDTLKEERWQRDRDQWLQLAARRGVEILVQAANSDDTRQVQDVTALISRKVDAIAIAPHNAEAMAKAVRLAHEAGIPVISYDRLIPDADVELYVGFDAVQVGQEQARFLVDRFRGQGPKRIVRIHGAKTDFNSHLVKQGQDSVLKPFLQNGQIVVVHEDWAENWKPENAKKIAQAAIARAGRFDAILAANDGTAGGAIQALAEEGLDGKVLVTGQDAELAACQRIARGAQSMTTYKLLSEETAAALDAAIKLATGKPVVARGAVEDGRTPAILLGVMAVTRDNLASTVVKDGFLTAEQVYGTAGAPATAATVAAR